MITVKRLKTFSGYAENIISGATYYPAQVVTSGVLNPLDKAITIVDNSDLGKLEPVRKKTRRISYLVRPIKSIIERRQNKSREDR